MPKKNNSTKPASRACKQALLNKPRNTRHAKPPRQKPAPSPASPSLPNPRWRRKPVRIGEALRNQGLDEHTIAGNYFQMAQKLAQDGAKVTAADKLLFDLQKECTRQLEATAEAEQKAAQQAERSASPDAPVIVHLVHNIPRPDRAPPDPP